MSSVHAAGTCSYAIAAAVAGGSSCAAAAYLLVTVGHAGVEQLTDVGVAVAMWLVRDVYFDADATFALYPVGVICKTRRMTRHSSGVAAADVLAVAAGGYRWPGPRMAHSGASAWRGSLDDCSVVAAAAGDVDAADVDAADVDAAEGAAVAAEADAAAAAVTAMLCGDGAVADSVAVAAAAEFAVAAAAGSLVVAAENRLIVAVIVAAVRPRFPLTLNSPGRRPALSSSPS